MCSNVGLLDAIHNIIYKKMGKLYEKIGDSNFEKSFSPTFSTLAISLVNSKVPCTLYISN